MTEPSGVEPDPAVTLAHEVTQTFVRKDLAGGDILCDEVCPATEDWARRARVFTTDSLADHPEYDADDVVLLVSELVTNSIEHAGSKWFILTLATVAGRDLRVVVTDTGQAEVPRIGEAGPLDDAGRGLRIVNALSMRWSIEDTHAGRLVWCDVGIPTFAARARSLMKAQKLTVDTLSERVHYSYDHVARTLSGSKAPSRTLATALDKGLGAGGALLALTPYDA